MSDEFMILPCPFCGELPLLADLTCGLQENDVDVRLAAFHCDSCGRGVQAPTLREAIDAWNRAFRAGVLESATAVARSPAAELALSRVEPFTPIRSDDDGERQAEAAPKPDV